MLRDGIYSLLVMKDWPSLNSLSADKVRPSVSPDCLSVRPHDFPQRLKPQPLGPSMDGLKPAPFKTRQL